MASAMLVDVWFLPWISLWVFFPPDWGVVFRAWVCALRFARCARARAAVTSWTRRGCAGFWEVELRTGEWDMDIDMISLSHNNGWSNERGSISFPRNLQKPLLSRLTYSAAT